MPKPKAKTSKLKPSRESTPVETKAKEPEKKEEKAPPELPWSEWIWEAEQTLYYRARLGADKRWEYQYAAGPPPVPTLVPVPSTTSEANRPYTPTNTLPIKCTKEDLELKVTYAPEPVYAYDVKYTVADPVISPQAEAPKTKGKEGPPEAKPENKEDKAMEKEKKDPEKTSRPSTPRKSHRERLRNLDRVEAYIEGLEPGKRKEKHGEKGHKKEGKHKEKRRSHLDL